MAQSRVRVSLEKHFLTALVDDEHWTASSSIRLQRVQPDIIIIVLVACCAFWTRSHLERALKSSLVVAFRALSRVKVLQACVLILCAFEAIGSL